MIFNPETQPISDKPNKSANTCESPINNKPDKWQKKSSLSRP